MKCKILNLVSLQAISRFNIAKHVPIDNKLGVSYTELSKRTGVDETQSKRFMRHAMTNRIFHEPQKNYIAHTSASQLIAENSDVLSWLWLTTEAWWPITMRTIDAVQKCPGSTNPKETGVSLWAGKETQWFWEIEKMKGGLTAFREAMAMLSKGEGWEDRHMVEGFDWSELPGNGTVVDVSIDS